MTFKIGDEVVGISHNFLEDLPDAGGVGMNSDMKQYWREPKVVLRIITKEILGRVVNLYQMSDSYLYNEDWIVPLTPKKVYHENPKINKVILKIKSMEESRKAKGYVY